MWIYVFGEVGGVDIKVGHSKADTLRNRIATVDGAQTRNETYVLLAGMLGPKLAEDAIHDYFVEWRRNDKGPRREYFWPNEALLEYVLWLRAQWWTCFDQDVPQTDWEEQHHADWTPTPHRRMKRPTPDPTKMIQDYEQHRGPLAGTAWAWIPDPEMSFHDYFTPPEIVAAAGQAMGGLDLDAASHWIANRRLHQAGVEVGDYFHVNRSAFENDWLPRTWLNPPYGDNGPWFRRALEMMEAGKLEQLCMLSPMWTFTTRIATEITRLATAAVVLSPTPRFHNPSDAARTGSNLPHAIFYWGDRSAEFLAAYTNFGIPCQVVWDSILDTAPTT